MSGSTTNLLATLSSITVWLNHSVSILQTVFGTLGNVLNIVIFTRRSLRQNPCSVYFLASSLNNLFLLWIIILIRYLPTNWDSLTVNNVLCKLRNLFTFAPLCLVLWFPALASIDRYLSSSRNIHYRRMSSLKVARWIVALTTVLMFLANSHVLFYLTYTNTSSSTSCYALSNDYYIFFNLFIPIVTCIQPILTMGIFGILVIANVRTARNRVRSHGSISGGNDRMRSGDRQLIRMLLLQMLIIIVLTVPFSVYLMYSAVAVVILKTRLSSADQAVVSFTVNILRLFYYTNPVVGFYTYTLASSKFRGEVAVCIRTALKYILPTARPMQ